MTEPKSEQIEAAAVNEHEITQAKVEIIYGLLWLMEIDTTTVTGMAASLARKTALEMIDKDGQARGIEIAKHAVRGKMLRATTSPPYINPRAG